MIFVIVKIQLTFTRVAPPYTIKPYHFTMGYLFVFRRGNCKNVSLGLDCEVGLRRRTYNVLAGSVLSVWTRVENILQAKTGHQTKMQVVRLRTAEGVKIVGKLSLSFIKLKGLETRNG